MRIERMKFGHCIWKTDKTASQVPTQDHSVQPDGHTPRYMGRDSLCQKKRIEMLNEVRETPS